MLLCIYLGARKGGIALGFWGGVGLFVIVLFFREAVPAPPWDVILIILAVICATAAMQAAGGIDYLVSIAARIIRKNPRRITFVGPLVAFVLTASAGTGHTLYPLLPVMHDTAVRSGIRPERPMSVAVIASLLGITASPVSAATLALATILEGQGVSIPQILAISAPAGLIGLLLACTVMYKWGKPLMDEPEYQRRVAAGEVEDIPLYVKLTDLARRKGTTVEAVAKAQGIPADQIIDNSAEIAALEARQDKERIAAIEKENGARPGSGRISAFIFLAAVILVVLLAAFPELRPYQDAEAGTRVTAVSAIMITMLAAAAVITLVSRVKAAVIPNTAIAKTGMMAIVCIFGLAWLGSTVIGANEALIFNAMEDYVQAHPALFVVMLFAMSILLFSQAAATRTIIPLGLSLGLGAPALIAMWPAVNAVFVLPTFGLLIAALNFDRTGTSRIGKFVFNHSYMIPGLVGVGGAIGFGFLFTALWGG